MGRDDRKAEKKARKAEEKEQRKAEKKARKAEEKEQRKAEKKARKAEKDAAKPSKASANPSRATAKPSRATAKPSRATAKPSRATAKPSKATAKAPRATAKPSEAGAKASKATAKGGKPATIPLTLVDEAKLSVRSASAIAPITGGHALVVDDDEGIYLLDPAGKAELLRGARDAKGLGDLESVCASPDGKTVHAISEDSGEVFVMRVKATRAGVTLSAPELLGTLARPGNIENKGWEGASHLVTRKHGACLVVAHEREPMALAIYTLPGLKEVATLLLDDTALGALVDDIADVAVCPKTDHLFVLSDQSHRIVEARLLLDEPRLEVLGVFDLELARKDKPEGIAFESPDQLVVVTDNPSKRLRFKLAPR